MVPTIARKRTGSPARAPLQVALRDETRGPPLQALEQALHRHRALSSTEHVRQLVIRSRHRSSPPRPCTRMARSGASEMDGSPRLSETLHAPSQVREAAAASFVVEREIEEAHLALPPCGSGSAEARGGFDPLGPHGTVLRPTTDRRQPLRALVGGNDPRRRPKPLASLRRCSRSIHPSLTTSSPTHRWWVSSRCGFTGPPVRLLPSSSTAVSRRSFRRPNRLSCVRPTNRGFRGTRRGPTVADSGGPADVSVRDGTQVRLQVYWEE
jgi:hypothetical protein